MNFTNAWFNRLVNEFEAIIDISDGTYKLLLQRMQDDVLQLRDALAKLHILEGDLSATKLQLQGFVRENEELKSKLASVQSTTLRASEYATRLTSEEILKFEAAKQLDEFLLALSQGQTINAIKSYRWVFGTGLKESKDRVEVIRGIR